MSSPEAMAHAMESYANALEHQVEVAKAFYLGQLAQGMEGLLLLPDDIRLRIDQLVWNAAGGVALDPTEEESHAIIAEAIMHSVEERMGMHEP